ncbi:hypothetical protein NGRA_0083 [Nosema granulosis]|uniref:Uncharacterized protein n=1 Tax=Nosema granulosis TaxID=83296 RepID=A0A9P6H2N0_9MICR|nr:hypothetical protein NGRA_0083 [Nosema granulosis]
MQLKPQESVYFLDNLTVADEMKLVNSTEDQDSFISKVFGKFLILSKEESNRNHNLEFVDLKYEESNELSFYLTMMLISSSPFYNFILKVKKNSKRIPPLVNDFYKVISTISNKQSVSVENFISFEGCRDVEEGYRYILSALHEQLLKYFYFSEEAWIMPKKDKSFKPIFPSISPITSMFHGKLLKDVGEFSCGVFDILRICKPQSVLDLFSSKDLVQVPSIVLIETSEMIEKLPNEYVVNAVLTEEREGEKDGEKEGEREGEKDGEREGERCDEDSHLVLYINSNKIWYRYKRDGMTILDSVDFSNIKYVLISKCI